MCMETKQIDLSPLVYVVLMITIFIITGVKSDGHTGTTYFNATFEVEF